MHLEISPEDRVEAEQIMEQIAKLDSSEEMMDPWVNSSKEIGEIKSIEREMERDASHESRRAMEESKQPKYLASS